MQPDGQDSGQGKSAWLAAMLRAECLGVAIPVQLDYQYARPPDRPTSTGNAKEKTGSALIIDLLT
jgi:hypothetical protein